MYVLSQKFQISPSIVQDKILTCLGNTRPAYFQEDFYSSLLLVKDDFPGLSGNLKVNSMILFCFQKNILCFLTISSRFYFSYQRFGFIIFLINVEFPFFFKNSLFSGGLNLQVIKYVIIKIKRISRERRRRRDGKEALSGS